MIVYDRGRLGGLPFEDAAEAELELDEQAELPELGEAVFVAEGAGHAGEVADRGDRGPKAAAEWLASGGASEVVVAATRAGRLGDDLEFPVRAPELDQRLLADRRLLERRSRLPSTALASSSSSASPSRRRFSARSEGARSSPCVISSVPWITRARPPIST